MWVLIFVHSFSHCQTLSHHIVWQLLGSFTLAVGRTPAWPPLSKCLTLGQNIARPAFLSCPQTGRLVQHSSSYSLWQFVVRAFAANQSCASVSYPSLSGWSVKGHFTVKSQAAVFFVRGGVRDATGSEGLLVLQMLDQWFPICPFSDFYFVPCWFI